MPRGDVPGDVAAIRAAINTALTATDAEGRTVGNSQYGIYAFYDYDGEPIYVGQTKEKLRTRIRRHLTNQRTDAVAMNVLDPFEVAEIEMWPLWDLAERGRYSAEERDERLNAAEYSVYRQVLLASSFKAVLNEKDIPETRVVELPPSARRRIIPASIYEARKHADVRIARRALTIASLAKVISERAVSKGLRRTLLTQARRLERLAAQRLSEVADEYPVEAPGEETGEAE